MVKDDAAFSTGKHKDSHFAEEAAGPGWSEEFHSGPVPTDQAWTKGKGPEGHEEHLEDLEDPCRSALMDCYNR